jgi:Fe-S cluster biosynthesis and repair protein YggX
LFVLPALLLILSLGMKKNIILLYLFVFFSLISSSVYLFIPRFHRENWKEAVNYIENNSTQNSASLLVNIAQGAPYNYYKKQTILIDNNNLNASYDKIFFIRYAQPIFDPKEEVLKKVEWLGYIKSQEKDFNGVTVWEYKHE